jgi:hypothetical protein
LAIPVERSTRAPKGSLRDRRQAAIAIDKARLYRAAQEEIERRKRVSALRDSEQNLKRGRAQADWRLPTPA